MQSFTAAELKSLFEDSSDILMKVSAAGEVLSCRTGGKMELPWAPAELIGQKLSKATHLLGGVNISEAITRVQQTHQPDRYTDLISFPDVKRWFELTLMPSDKETILLIMRDVTEKKKAEALFKSIFNNAFSFTGLLDLNGHVLELNKAALDFCGLTLPELQGSSFIEAPLWGRRHPEIKKLSNAIGHAAKGTFVRYEANVLGAGKESHTLDMSLKPVFDEGQEVVYIIFEGRLITEEKRLQVELRDSTYHHRLLANNIPNGGVFIFDRRLKYIFVEGELFEKGILSRKDYLDKTLFEALPEEQAVKVLPHYKAALNGVTFSERVAMSTGHYYSSYSPLYSNNEVSGGMLLVIDISEMATTEEKLNRTIRELQQKNSELEHFSHISSHDLQEPLRMVVSFTQLLAERYSGSLDENGKEYIQFAKEGAQRMHDIIHNLRLYTEIEKLHNRLATVNTEEVWKLVLGRYSREMEKTGAVITYDKMPEIKGEPVQFRYLIANLLDNAIKFRKPNIAPQIHLSVEETDTQWVFRLSDNGIGIRKNYLDKVFQIFQRLHTRDEYPGMGVGLSLCKKIVEWHGGRIHIESVYGEGSVVSFSFSKNFCAIQENSL